MYLSQNLKAKVTKTIENTIPSYFKSINQISREKLGNLIKEDKLIRNVISKIYKYFGNDDENIRIILSKCLLNFTRGLEGKAMLFLNSLLPFLT